MSQENKQIRVVIDTNLCISMLVGKRVAELRPVFALPQYELITSESLIEEIRRVTQRPKFARYFHQSDVEDFILFLSENSTPYKIEKITRRCRDPKDDFLLELALLSDADILLSGDSDLTDMRQIGKTVIMSATDFMLSDLFPKTRE